MKKFKKGLLALALVAILVISCIPVPAIKSQDSQIPVPHKTK